MSIKIITYHPNPNDIRTFSYFAYEQFLANGRGVIFLKPDANEERGFSFEYISGDEAMELASEDVSNYDPDREMVFLIRRGDNLFGSKIYRFEDITMTPKYLHSMSDTFFR